MIVVFVSPQYLICFINRGFSSFPFAIELLKRMKTKYAVNQKRSHIKLRFSLTQSFLGRSYARRQTIGYYVSPIENCPLHGYMVYKWDPSKLIRTSIASVEDHIQHQSYHPLWGTQMGSFVFLGLLMPKIISFNYHHLCCSHVIKIKYFYPVSFHDEF